MASPDPSREEIEIQHDSPRVVFPCVVLMTVPSLQEAEKVAHVLIEEQLAACVKIIEIQSVYRWKGDICHEPEWQLIVKTDMAKFSNLEKKVTHIHPYEVPEIVVLPIIQGHQPYLQWIGNEMAR